MLAFEKEHAVMRTKCTDDKVWERYKPVLSGTNDPNPTPNNPNPRPRPHPSPYPQILAPNPKPGLSPGPNNLTLAPAPSLSRC